MKGRSTPEESMRELAERLTQRRTPDRLGWRGEVVQTHAERAARPLQMADAVGGGELQRRAAAQEDLPLVDVPPDVVQALQACHKPFQLWNVKREEIEHDYELERQPKFAVGQGALLGEEEQVPWTLERSTQAIKTLMDAAEMQAFMERAHKDWFKYVWRDSLPFGKPDPTPEEEALGNVIKWDPLSGEPPPPGIRLPPGFEPS